MAVRKRLESRYLVSYKMGRCACQHAGKTVNSRNSMNFHRQKKSAALLLACILLAVATITVPRAQAAETNRWFNTLVAHWTDYGTPEYLDFIGEARPEIAQVGFYGLTFYSLAHTPFYKGYPAHFPVQGTAECGEFFTRLNREIHSRGSKVVGHFNMTFIFGDPAKKAGFFEWYEKGWNDAEFGAKPCADPTEMLQRDGTGALVVTHSYKIGGWPEYHGCLNNPKWRACLKAMAKSAITRGVDGLIANYYYRRDCLCEFCVAGFRRHLATNFSAAELRDRLGIADVAAHKFTEIPSWHDPKQTTPFRMAALRWTQLALKDAFDDVLLRYGRALKPDLLVAQWNHLGAFNQINGDERCALPGDVWGRGEDYLWYSTGNAASQTDLANGDLGDGTLQLRYLRGAFGPKPFVLGKYEQTRTRAAIAEGLANAGGGMGFYAPFKNPAGREALVTYFRFAREQRERLFLGAQPAAELLLLYPRSAVHAGNVAPVAQFRALGKMLVRAGFAFDIVPDDLLNAESLRGRAALACVDETALTPGAKKLLAEFSGRRLPALPGEFALTNATPDAATWQPGELARVTRRTGSARVAVSVLAPATGNRRLVHLVNYDREEPAKGVPTAGRGPQDEKPTAVENLRIELPLAAGQRVKSVRVYSPDREVTQGAVAFTVADGKARFTVPRVLVYSVAEVEFE